MEAWWGRVSCHFKSGRPRNVPNLLEMSECRDRQVGTEAHLGITTSSVQWTDRHCKWLPGWGAEALFAGRSWAAEKEGRESVSVSA